MNESNRCEESLPLHFLNPVCVIEDHRTTTFYVVTLLRHVADMPLIIECFVLVQVGQLAEEFSL